MLSIVVACQGFAEHLLSFVCMGLGHMVVEMKVTLYAKLCKQHHHFSFGRLFFFAMLKYDSGSQCLSCVTCALECSYLQLPCVSFLSARACIVVP